MRISDWSSDVCSSDLRTAGLEPALPYGKQILSLLRLPISPRPHNFVAGRDDRSCRSSAELRIDRQARDIRSEEHTSELQSLMRISYAVFCLKKKKQFTQLMNTSDQEQTSIQKHMT